MTNCGFVEIISQLCLIELGRQYFSCNKCELIVLPYAQNFVGMCTYLNVPLISGLVYFNNNYYGQRFAVRTKSFLYFI